MAVLIATAGLALLAACSGGSSGSHVARLSSTAPQNSPSAAAAGGLSDAGGSQDSQLLAFAGCMRSHGVPNFPDPASANKFPGAQQLGVSSAQYQAALNACKHLLPNGGNAPNQAELSQERTALLPFARCMRSHGLPDWPDPTIRTNSRGTTAVVFNFIGTSLDDKVPGPHSPQVQQCSHLLPPSNGGAPPYGIVES